MLASGAIPVNAKSLVRGRISPIFACRGSESVSLPRARPLSIIKCSHNLKRLPQRPRYAFFTCSWSPRL